MPKQKYQCQSPGGSMHRMHAFLLSSGNPACMPAQPDRQARHAQVKQAGQSAVEFALVVSIAIIMFLGMMQFGMYLYGLSIVENAARNGARQGSVSQACPSCEATSAAQASLQGQPVIRDASVAVLAPGGVVGSTVKIRVTAQLPMIVPGGSTFGLGPLTTVSAEATFRQEGWKP